MSVVALFAGIALGAFITRHAAIIYRQRWKAALALIERMDDGEHLTLERVISARDKRLAAAMIAHKRERP